MSGIDRGRRVDKVTVYSSDLSYFVGTAAIELLTILIILYTFYGWWRLGECFKNGGRSSV